MSSKYVTKKQQERKHTTGKVTNEVNFLSANYAQHYINASNINTSRIDNNITQPQTTVSNNVSSLIHYMSNYNYILLLTCT